MKYGTLYPYRINYWVTSSPTGSLNSLVKDYPNCYCIEILTTIHLKVFRITLTIQVSK